MTNSKIVPVILCGGAGVRLWPLSRNNRPKQFQPLVGDKSTFGLTLERVADPAIFAPPLIVTAADHRHLVADALRKAESKGEMLLEPARRDSAAAVAAATALIAGRDPSALLLVLAADHVIRDIAGFRSGVEKARRAAEAGRIVTFGIRPTRPATGFGYIARGEPLADAPEASGVARFVEKPDAEKAARYIGEGYLWNSGNFMMRAETALDELRRLAPGIASGAKRAVDGIRANGRFLRLPADLFGEIPALSFDYALMEKTDRAAVVEAEFDWRDVGSFEALAEIEGQDEEGNSLSGDVSIRDSRNAIVHTARGTVAVLGMDDVVVAAGEEGVLVAARGRLDELKGFVGELGKSDPVEDSRVLAPWGYFEVIVEGPGYKAKRIVVDPGERLSLQRHKHRAEHWVVVEGLADVTIGSELRQVGANQSVFIPQTEIHRLGNSSEEPLTLIEVQFGSYLGEDDIERLDDDYRRVPKVAAAE